MTLPLGTLLQNRYRVDALLGQGGMGAVYRGHDLVLNRPCALKEMAPPPWVSPAEVAQFRTQFLQEASVLANLSHPGLPRVSDYFAWGAVQVLVMDYVAGESLDSLIRRSGALPESRVLGWAAQLLDALAYCHHQGVIHRDIKPGNIIISPSGQAVLVDFGLVKVWDAANPQTMTVMRGMGTPAYAPPEQYVAGAGHTDARSDLYSLGATLYHALTGREPPQSTLRMADPSSLARPGELNPALGASTQAAVLKAMELGKAQRFASAEEMRAAFAAKPTPRRRHVGFWAGLAVLAALLLTGGVIWLAARKPAGTPTPVAGLPASALTARTPAPSRTATPATPTLSATPRATSTPTRTPTLIPGSAGADRAIAFSAGPGAGAKYGSPEAALGAPDIVENPCCQGMLQLGRGGSVLLAFTDNTIVDGSGADLAVYGESARDDFVLIEVSADGQEWIAFPKKSESPGGLDLADTGLENVVFVRLTDLQPGTSTGAEIDAVVALHSGPAYQGSLHILPDAVARAVLTLREGPDARMKETGQAAAGAPLTVLGRSLVSGWVKVQSASGDAGWCPAANVGLNVSLGGYQVAQAPATPTPLNQPKLLLSDDFSDSSSGMGQSNATNYTTSYAGSEYHIRVRTSNHMAWGYHHGSYTDFTAEVAARDVGGDSCWKAALLLRIDGHTFYYYWIRSDGTYGLSLEVDDTWLDSPLPSTGSSSIRTGNGTNVLKATCKGRQITLYVNGQLLTTVTSSAISSGNVAVAAATCSGDADVEIAFDNFRIWSAP